MSEEARVQVWKFPLVLQDQFIVDMPEGAQILHFTMQGDVPTVWALVDKGRPMSPRKLAIIGTGHPAPTPEEGRYIGSCFHGPFVWHLFEAITQ